MLQERRRPGWWRANVTNLAHLRNMTLATEMGEIARAGAVSPPVPASRDERAAR